MATIDLKYGKTSIPFEYNGDQFEVLGATNRQNSLTDAEIGKRLDAPIDSLPIEEIVNPGESILIVVPDATRQTGCGQVINLLVRRLIANGSPPSDITIIFATGIHRKVTEAEKAEILTPFIAQRIKTLDHDPRDLAKLIRLGETSGGIPVELNRALVDNHHVILIGGIGFHYFAGFTGGRKLVCPGLASSKTISTTHKLAFNCETMARRDSVHSGLLDRNEVHNAFIEAVSKVSPGFAINTIVDDDGSVTDLFCGDWITSHRAASDEYAGGHTIKIAGKRDLVVVSSGGFPHDINLIQAHKAIDAASYACNDGGTIVLVAECPDGMGRNDFLKWFETGTSQKLAEKLCEKYQVNGQTAWSLLQKAERFDIQVISSLDSNDLITMRLRPLNEISRVSTDRSKRGYILPNGAKFMIQR